MRIFGSMALAAAILASCPAWASGMHKGGHYSFGEPGKANEITRTVEVIADDRNGMRYVMDLGSIRQAEFIEANLAVLSDEHFLVSSLDGNEIFDVAGATSFIHAEGFFVTELFSDVADDWKVTVYTDTGDWLDEFKTTKFPEMSATVSDGKLTLTVNGEAKIYES